MYTIGRQVSCYEDDAMNTAPWFTVMIRSIGKPSLAFLLELKEKDGA